MQFIHNLYNNKTVQFSYKANFKKYIEILCFFFKSKHMEYYTI